MTADTYDPAAELVADVTAPPILVDRRMLGVFLGLSPSQTRHLFERYRDRFTVRGTRIERGLTVNLYDLAEAAACYERHLRLRWKREHRS